MKKSFFSRSGLILAMCLFMALPGLSQTVTFGGGPSANGFGIGDVISIFGGSRGDSGVYRGDNRNDKLQTAIQVAGILYQLSRSRTEAPTYPSNPYPGNPYPNNPYPNNPYPNNPYPNNPYPNNPYPNNPYPNNPYPDNYPEYPTAPSHNGGLLRPDGYEAITFSGRTIRLDPSILPLSINPGDGRYYQEVASAVQTWNNAGLGTLFEMTNGQADLTIDWSGSRVSPGARAETRMAHSRSAVVPTDLSVKTGGRSSEQLARVVTHELGHVLGMDHSSDRGDVMYRSEQNYSMGLTQRDRQMLHWLYSQTSYTPVVGRTDISQGGVVARGLGTNFSGGGTGTDWNPQSVCSFHLH